MREQKTRLKWMKSSKGIHVSEPVLVGSEIVCAYVNPKLGNYHIKDINQKYCYASGTGDTLRTLKQEAKNRLIYMRARFYDEVRLPKSKK